MILPKLTLFVALIALASGLSTANKVQMNMDLTCDNTFELFVNGNRICSGEHWTTTYNCKAEVNAGDVIAIDGRNSGQGSDNNPAAFIGVFNGVPTKPSDWRCKDTTNPGALWNKNNFDDSSWPEAVSYGRNDGSNIWRNNAGVRPNIPGEAQWLWTSNNKNHDRIYCRYVPIKAVSTSATHTAASEKQFPTQAYGWYTRSGGVENNPYTGVRQLVIRWNGATIYDGPGKDSGPVVVAGYSYYPSTYRAPSLYGWSSDHNNAFDIYRTTPIAATAPAVKLSDMAKQMSDQIDQNLQRMTEELNLVKDLHSKAVTAAAASKILFDSASSEAVRLKREMENALAAATTSRTQCQTASNHHISASATHSSAVSKLKDVANIDKELAVITELKKKLEDLTNIKLQISDQQSNVQLQHRAAVARAVSDASDASSLRPSTSLMLAELVAGVGSGRLFTETGEINKLLDSIVAKLNAERAKIHDDELKARNNVNSASSDKETSCNAAKVASDAADRATSAYKSADDKLRARTDELNTANAEAARILQLVTAAQANYDKESASFIRVKQFITSGTDSVHEAAKTALQAEITTLKGQLTTCEARVSTLNKRAEEEAASENTKVTASGPIEDFAPDGLAGQVLVQAICVAIQKAAGWTFAVQRPCGNNQQTCASVCTKEDQSGKLEPFNAIHMYGNQATNQAGKFGLKTYRYNSGRDAGGCGPNYCCCGGGGAQALLELGDASSVEQFLESAEEIDGGDNTALAEQVSIDEIANHLVGESELEMEKLPAQSLAGVAATFEQFGAAGQILAQAACTAINPSGGYNFAIIKGCDVSTDCATLCAQAGKESGSPSALQCQESLHLYHPSWNSRATTDLKVYRYFGCGGGCGPNYCCCHGRANFKQTDLEEENDADLEENEKPSSVVAVNELEMHSKNFVSSTAAQVLAESACTSINSVGGWTFAVRRTTTDKRACQNVCSDLIEGQAGNLKCVDSLSIGGTNHPMVDDASRVKLGLMTYKHGNCVDMSANYCCCKNL